MPSNQSEVQLTPYVEVDGQRTISDHFVEGFFLSLQEEGMHEVVFPTGNVRTSVEFLAHMKLTTNVPVFAFVEKGLAGVAWLNSITETSALCHFAASIRAGGQIALDVGREILDYWFSMKNGDDAFLFDVIVGMIPESNKAAQSFSEKVGFNLVGAVPNLMRNVYSGEKEALVIYYFERGG